MWDELEATKYFQRQSFTKYSRLNLVYMSNSTLQEKFNFHFSGVFMLVLIKFSFWQEDWALGNHSNEKTKRNSYLKKLTKNN